MKTLIPAALLILGLAPAAALAQPDRPIGPLAQAVFSADDDDRPELFLPDSGDSDPSNFQTREGDSDPSNFEPEEGDSDPDRFESPDLDELSQPGNAATRRLA